MSKLTLADTRSAITDAWDRSRKAAAKFGGTPRQFFRKALEHAYEAARASADRLAFEMMSPAEKLLYQVADRQMRAGHIDNHFQHREELATIDRLETEGKALLAAEEADLEAFAAYAAEASGPVYRPVAAPVRSIPVAFALTIAATTSPVDPGTMVDLRGICGHRRHAA